MNGVLHTNSAYYNDIDWSIEQALHFSDLDIDVSLNEALDYAKQQELLFYHSYFKDVNDYDTFIIRMRKLFANANEDGKRIQNLGNANLNSYIPKDSLKPQFSYQLTITGDLCQQIPIELLNSENVQVEGGPIYLTLNLESVGVIKQLINKEVGHRRFREESLSMQKLQQWFGQQIVNEGVAKQLTDNISITKTKINNHNIAVQDEIEGFIFAKNLDKKQRQAYLNGELGPGLQKQFQEEMQKALNKIKDFIFNSCLQVNQGMLYNGVNILKQAAEETWREVITSKPIDSQDFFFEGANLNKSILGKGGEFQLALMDRYVRLVLLQSNDKVGQIIGDIIKDKRGEPRSDYQLVVELGGDVGNSIIGIQVKNIGETSMQEVQVKTDAELIAPNLSIGFSDAIANSYFNTNIQAQTGDIIEYLKKYLTTYFWKAMNLNIGPELNPYHTNTFYWVGGSALVPASKIIETLQNSNSKAKSTPHFDIIRANWTGLSDNDFLNTKDSDGDPIFTEYWYGYQNNWTPLFSNYKLYQELLSKTKIYTSFSMGRIFSQNKGMASFTFFNG